MNDRELIIPKLSGSREDCTPAKVTRSKQECNFGLWSSSATSAQISIVLIT